MCIEELCAEYLSSSAMCSVRITACVFSGIRQEFGVAEGVEDGGGLVLVVATETKAKIEIEIDALSSRCSRLGRRGAYFCFVWCHSGWQSMHTRTYNSTTAHGSRSQEVSTKAWLREGLVCMASNACVSVFRADCNSAHLVGGGPAFSTTAVAISVVKVNRSTAVASILDAGNTCRMMQTYPGSRISPGWPCNVSKSYVCENAGRR